MSVSFKFPGELFSSEREFVTFGNFIRRFYMMNNYNIKIIGVSGTGIKSMYQNTEELSSYITDNITDVYAKLTDIEFENIGMEENEIIKVKVRDGFIVGVPNKFICLNDIKIINEIKPINLDLYVANQNGFRTEGENNKVLGNNMNIIAISSNHSRVSNIPVTHDEYSGTIGIKEEELRKTIDLSMKQLLSIKNSLKE